jgi:S1-C subfamily serine protease
MGVEILPSSEAGQGTATNPTTTKGVVIEGVIASSPAASSALVTGDGITSLNGQSVTTTLGLVNILQALKPGDSVQVDYVNLSGASQSLSLQLTSGPAQ